MGHWIVSKILSQVIKELASNVKYRLDHIRSGERKLLKRFVSGIVVTLVVAGILPFLIDLNCCSMERIIEIVDAETGLDSITLGSETEPIPPEGFPFTVNITLDGFIEKLSTYQIAVGFNQTKVKCTTAWISETDPNFVFHGKAVIIPDPYISDRLGYVVLGASLQNILDPVTVSQGLFCQINFSAIKNGTSTLDIIPTYSPDYPDDTFLWDDQMQDIPFDSQSLSVTVITGRSPPIASFTFSPSNPKPGWTITFDASESYDPEGYIASYIWDFGDGTNLTAISHTTTHNYTSTGVYPVNLTVFDNDGLYNLTTCYIFVGKRPIAEFTLSPENPLPDEEIVFDASLSSDPDGYIALFVWDFGDYSDLVEIDATDPNIPELWKATHTYIGQGGLYPVVLTIYDNDGLYNSTTHIVNVTIRGRTTIIFNVVWEHTKYQVLVSSNSTVTHFDFNQSLGQIEFEVSGETSIMGYCNVTIPKSLLAGDPWTVMIEGESIANLISSDNETHSFIYFTYIHASTLQITIQGTWVISEFPSLLVLPLFMIVTLLAAIMYRSLACKHTLRSKKHWIC